MDQEQLYIIILTYQELMIIIIEKKKTDNHYQLIVVFVQKNTQISWLFLKLSNLILQTKSFSFFIRYTLENIAEPIYFSNVILLNQYYFPQNMLNFKVKSINIAQLSCKKPFVIRCLTKKCLNYSIAGIYAQNYLKKQQLMTEEYSEFQNHFEEDSENLKGICTSWPKSPEDQNSFNYGPKWAQNITDISFQLELTNQNTQVIKQAWKTIVDTPCQDQDNQDDQNKELGQENTLKIAQKNQKDLKQLIYKNCLLTIKEKKYIIKNLPTGNLLASTITELTHHFKEQHFDELLFLIFNIWKQFQEFKVQKLSRNILTPVYPQMKNFNFQELSQFDLHSFQLDQQQNRFLMNLDIAQLIKRADKISEELAFQLQFKQQLKILKNIAKELKGSSQISQFKTIFRKICRAVFLSAANCYQYQESLKELNPFKRPLTTQFSSFGDLLSDYNSDSEDELESGPRKLRKYH